MKLEHRTENNVDIVALPNRLVMANAAEARSDLKQVIQQGSGRVVINLSQTEFMDSSGLAVVVAGLQAARKMNGDVHLAHMSDTIRALFELTRLHTVFQIFDDEADAVAAFA
ncbi:MAG: STAS domain-containing protein [Thiohalocapsa sp.]|jgi:anti-sigma B factor antagonist|nr:STAS domain-containing protein [Thiohalocapsa sp.]MCF7991030.1 STAS domain-containing protein [Thiohalocapsa sp.]